MSRAESARELTAGAPRPAEVGAPEPATRYVSGQAVVHRAGGRPSSIAEIQGPRRNGVGLASGIVGTSPTLASSGDVMLMALRRGGVAITRDGGDTWRRACPPDHEGSSHRRGEHGYVWADAATGRVYYVTFAGLAKPSARFGHWSSGSLLSWSEDGGETWVSTPVGRDTWDWPKILAGPPRSGPVDGSYPNVLYFLGRSPFVLGPLTKVYRSRDGGHTWEATANVASDGLEPGYGVVAPDGTIYIDEPYFAGPYGKLRGSPYPYRWRDQGRLRLLVSRDEGDTWEHLVIPGARAPRMYYGIQRVAVDEAGTLYFAWRDSRSGLPYLTWSNDGGASWSQRRMVAPPEVRSVGYQVQVVAREAGHVAVAYYGSRQRWGLPSMIYLPDGREHHGYITETFNATADEPVYQTARVNPASDPLLPRLRIADGPGEAQGITFDADGQPWATFTKVTQAWRPGWSVFMRNPPTELYVGQLRAR